MTLHTPHGPLPADSIPRYNEDESLESALIHSQLEWELPCGWLTPQYLAEDAGRRNHAWVHFHPNGALKTLPLQSRTPVNVGEEILPAELVTFYDTGEVRRVFPSSGKLSGFWTEEQEGAVTPIVTLAAGIASITAKLISAEFFPSGILSNVALWPGETVSLHTNVGTIHARSGISFFENGCLRSYEPATTIDVETPIGMLTAYDTNAVGIAGDLNSLRFNRLGAVESLITMNCTLQVEEAGQPMLEFRPKQIQSYCSEGDTELIGLHVYFLESKLIIGNPRAHGFDLTSTTISIQRKLFAPHAAHC